MGKSNIDILPELMYRKSCRRFKNERLSDEDILGILEAGRLSPSGHNFQGWKFIIIKKQDTKDKIVELVIEYRRKYYKFLKYAPVLIAIVVDPESTTAELDCAIAGYSMQLEAWSRGIGSCMAAYHPAIVEESEIATKDLLGINQKLYISTIIAFGYPGDNGYRETKRKPLEKIVCREKYYEPLITMKIFERKRDRRSADERGDFQPDNIACPVCKIPSALIWVYGELYCEECGYC